VVLVRQTKTYDPEEWAQFCPSRPDEAVVGDVGEALVALATNGRWLKIPPGRRGDGGQDVLTPRGWFLQVKSVGRASHAFVDAHPFETARRAHITVDVHVDLLTRSATIRGWAWSADFYERRAVYEFPNTGVTSFWIDPEWRHEAYKEGVDLLEAVICTQDPFPLLATPDEFPGYPALLANMAAL
jgi:hypothetical protein